MKYILVEAETSYNVLIKHRTLNQLGVMLFTPPYEHETPNRKQLNYNYEGRPKGNSGILRTKLTSGPVLGEEGNLHQHTNKAHYSNF